MVGRALLFIILVTFIIAGMITDRINASNRRQAENIVSMHFRHEGRNLARTGVNMALTRIEADTAWRAGYASAASPMSLFGGSLFVTVSDTDFFGKNVVRIASVASTGPPGGPTRSDTSIAYVFRTFMPGSIMAAITTNNDVMTNGDLLVDGREHDLQGNLVPNSGTWALWTTRDYLMPTGSSTMGGTTNSAATDVAPIGWPGDSVVIRTNQIWSGGVFPSSPDSVLGGSANGFPEGTLKGIARSGMGGSQYVTNPAMLTYPLRGVTYVELPISGPEQTWNPANISGSGLIVVHNQARNAIIKNLQVGKDQKFTGLLIADDIDKMNGAVVIGAVISLTADLSSGNVIGNGSGEIYFSREAVREATASWLGTPLHGSRNHILAWWE